MITLTLRTDKPEAELGLYQNGQQIDYHMWHAHRELSVTFLQAIIALLAKHQYQLTDVAAIVAYKGPGSFTGLRIGLSVANALAYSQVIPIVGVEGEDQWLERGLQLVADGHNHRIVLPAYGAPPHITQPRK